jgi:hypothetical protein
MELLAQLQTPWPNRAKKTINMIRVLAERWRVLGALPIKFSAKVETSPANEGANLQVLQSSSVMPTQQDTAHLRIEDLLSGTSGPETSFGDVDNMGPSSYVNFDVLDSEALNFATGAQQRFDDFLSTEDTSGLYESGEFGNFSLWNN